MKEEDLLSCTSVHSQTESRGRLKCFTVKRFLLKSTASVSIHENAPGNFQSRLGIVRDASRYESDADESRRVLPDTVAQEPTGKDLPWHRNPTTTAKRRLTLPPFFQRTRAPNTQNVGSGNPGHHSGKRVEPGLMRVPGEK